MKARKRRREKAAREQAAALEKAAAPVRGIPKPLLVGICVGSIREDVDCVLESWRNPS